MRRRDFVTFVARAAAVRPGIALAQQSAGKVWRVAYLYRAWPLHEIERREFLRHLPWRTR